MFIHFDILRWNLQTFVYLIYFSTMSLDKTNRELAQRVLNYLKELDNLYELIGGSEFYTESQNLALELMVYVFGASDDVWWNEEFGVTTRDYVTSFVGRFIEGDINKEEFLSRMEEIC